MEETGNEISLVSSQLEKMREFIEAADFEVASVKLVGRTDGYVELRLRERAADEYDDEYTILPPV